MVENVKIEKVKCDILGNFQTLWVRKSGLKKSIVWPKIEIPNH